MCDYQITDGKGRVCNVYVQLESLYKIINPLELDFWAPLYSEEYLAFTWPPKPLHVLGQ